MEKKLIRNPAKDSRASWGLAQPRRPRGKFAGARLRDAAAVVPVGASQWRSPGRKRHDRKRSDGERTPGFSQGRSIGSAALAGAGGLFGRLDLATGEFGVSRGPSRTARYKMAFIQWQPHTVPAAWSKGIEEVLKPQQTIDYQLLDGQNKVEVQASLMDTLISQGASVIFLQPINSVALAPSIAKAKRAGIAVITLNIDATEPHAAHVEMNHYLRRDGHRQDDGRRHGRQGQGRDPQRAAGHHHPRPAHERVRRRAEERTIRTSRWWRIRSPTGTARRRRTCSTPSSPPIPISAASMASTIRWRSGAVDVAKEKGLIGKLVIFGNDGEVAALESIEAGELTGTQYTDVYQQGRLAAGAATVLATGGVPATAFARQSHLLMPYVIATKAECRVHSAFPALVASHSAAGRGATRRGPPFRDRSRCRDAPPGDRSAPCVFYCDRRLLLRDRAALRHRDERGEPHGGVLLRGHPRDGASLPHFGPRDRPLDRRHRRRRRNGRVRHG